MKIETNSHDSEHESPPPNPLFKATPVMTKDIMTLDEGMAILHWPAELKPESVHEFEYWINGLLRRVRRKAGLKPK